MTTIRNTTETGTTKVKVLDRAHASPEHAAHRPARRMVTPGDTMRQLAFDVSTHFNIDRPSLYCHSDDDPLYGFALLVDDARAAFRRGAVGVGIGLNCWAPFLLATVIGHDGLVVESLGMTLALHLEKLGTTAHGAHDVEVGEQFGIHLPEQHVASRRESEWSAVLWQLAREQVGHATTGFGLRVAFWAAYASAAKFADEAVEWAKPAAAAAGNFRTFANGRGTS